MRTEDIRNMAKAYAAVQEKAKNEALSGDQHKIDANGNGKIDGHDFKMLRKKSKKETATKSTTTISNNAKTDTDVQTQEAKGDNPPFSGGKPVKDVNKDRYGNVIKDKNRPKHLAKMAMQKQKDDTTKEAVEIDEAAATAQHKPDEKTSDTKEKQLKRSKGEKDFVDQHKAETPEAGDEPKVDAMNFQKFKAMTAKIGKDNSRKADNKKGDNNIVPSGTPIKDPAAPKIREQSEQLDELSIDTLDRYREKAIKDKEKNRQKLYKAGFPSSKDSDYKHKKFKERVKRKEKRDKGLDRSWKQMVDRGAIKGRKPGEYGMMLVPHQQPKGKKG